MRQLRIELQGALEGQLRVGNAAPYACQWRMPAATGKRYDLQSLAYNAAGNVGGSAIVTVTAQ